MAIKMQTGYLRDGMSYPFISAESGRDSEPQKISCIHCKNYSCEDDFFCYYVMLDSAPDSSSCQSFEFR